MLEKRITYDWSGEGAGPDSGDVLRTKRGRLRLVVRSRRVRSRVHPSRWALQVVDVAEAPAGVRVYELRWNKRERKAR